MGWLILVAVLLLPLPGRGAGRQVVRGHVPRVVSQLSPVGRLPATQQLNLAIGLPLRNTQALKDLLRDLYDPSSPRYRHYLTPAQFAAEFGPTQEDYEAVAAFARARGLTVTGRHPNRLILDVRGSAGAIENALHVKMRVYRHPTEPRTFYAPDTDPSLDLAVPVLHIGGLDTYSIPHPNLKIKPARVAALATPSSGSGPSGNYAGGDFRAAYLPGVTLTGAGQSVALLEFDGYYASDITAYKTEFGLTAVPLTNVAIDGGVSTPGSGDAEVSLDIEMAMAMAPGLSNIYVYEAPNPSPWDDLLNRIANDNLAKQISCSWSGGSPDATAETIFQQMAAQGQSFFNAVGDSDAFTGSIPFPSDSPHITEVGGTTLTTTGAGGTYVSETVWNWGNDGGTYVGTSGGISTYYAIPSWQQGVSMSGNQGSTTKRNVPDVALTANNIWVCYNNGGSGSFGGTSCAAPLWAAFIALVNQQAVSQGEATAGFINPTIYALGTGTSYGSTFHDITTGNNFSSSSPSKFSAVTGFDLCTGWGTPAGAALIAALAPLNSPQISGSAFITGGPVGGPFSPGSAAYTLVNTGSSSLTWTAGATQGWLSLSATAGTLGASGSSTVTASINANGNALSSGSYSDTITFTNVTAGASQTEPVSLSVLVAPVITSTLTATATNGAGFSYQIAASNGPATYGASGLPSGLSVNTSTGLISGTATVTGTSNVTISATNAGGTGTATLVLTVLPHPPVITSTLTATATNGAAFSYQILASNSPASYGASGLPSGLGVNSSTGLINGSTTVTGTSSVTISATNPGGTGSATLKIIVLPAVPVITSTLTATATNGAGFSYQIAATHSPASYGATGLPSGLAVNSSTGKISGTTTATGTSNVTVSASNAGGTGSATLVLTVLPPPPVITSALTATAANSTAFSYQIAASNSPTSYGASGLPSGLSVNNTTGLISGATSATGTSNVTISASNAGGTGNATLKITVLPAPPVITGTLSATGTSGIAFSYQIAATNSPTSYGASGLPSGLGINTSTGLISGTAAVTGSTNVAISATNVAGSGNATLVLTMLPPPPVITSALTAITGAGELFNYGITASGNPSTYNATGLPTGLAVNTATGLISGTAAASGTSNVTLSAVNAGGTGSATLVLTVTPASPPVITGTGATTLFSFTGTSGAYPGSLPGAGLVTPAANTFYGATTRGGGSNDGTLFSITSQGTFTALCSFTGTAGAYPGALPSGPLCNPGDGNVYGTTQSGGSANDGTVFRINNAGTFTTLCSFTGTNGSAPLAGVVSVGESTLYGTTASGGSANQGTVFSIAANGSVNTLCSFTGTNGSQPNGLIQGKDGNFYGTTYQGGSNGLGTVFMVTSSGSLTTLCSFTGTNGSLPCSGLIQGSDGNFYGTTYQGGAFNDGTVFQVTASGSLNSLCSFTGSIGTAPGQTPNGSLIQGSNGSFYGTTEFGGPGNAGTIFQVTSGGALTTLYLFTDGSDGGNSLAGLFQTSNGNLYGATSAGGANNLGGVFQFNPAFAASGTTGSGFTYQVIATNNPASYNATGLPAGLAINTATGLISGTATTSGTSTVTLSASNIAGTGTAGLTITVQSPPVPVITSGASVLATEGQPFTYQIVATNNPTSYSATGLPPGLFVTGSSGFISGTPSATGTDTVTISATNPGGTVNQALTIVIQTPYAAWLSAEFPAGQLANSAVAGMTASPAGDGIPNLLKYALNLNPKTNDTGGLPAGSIITTGSGNYLSLTYTQVISAIDITYTVQVSNDMRTWNSGTGYTTTTSVVNNADGVTQTVTVQGVTPLGTGNPSQFIRLQVTQP